MKRLLLLCTLFVFVMACEEDTSPDHQGVVTEDQIDAGKSSVPTSCSPMSGSARWTKTGTYNCHQYVKGALVSNQVDLYDGEPDPVNFATAHTNASIQSDNNFLRVCYLFHAEATAVLPSSKDHSSLILGDGSHGYSTPGGSSIYASGSPLNYSTACDYEYFASIEDITLSGPTVSGSNYTFTLNNVGSHSYVLTDANRWSYSTSAFNTITKTNTTLTISPKSGTSGNYTVTAEINSAATDSPTGACATGVNGYQTASTYTPTRSKSFTVASSCGGSLNGGPLYTFNTVSRNTNHQVQMDVSGWSWTKTSGTATWSTSGSGQYMNFNMPSGSATFRATKSGCAAKTITFYAY